MERRLDGSAYPREVPQLVQLMWIKTLSPLAFCKSTVDRASIQADF